MVLPILACFAIFFRRRKRACAVPITPEHARQTVARSPKLYFLFNFPAARDVAVLLLDHGGAVVTM